MNETALRAAHDDGPEATELAYRTLCGLCGEPYLFSGPFDEEDVREPTWLDTVRSLYCINDLVFTETHADFLLDWPDENTILTDQTYGEQRWTPHQHPINGFGLPEDAVFCHSVHEVCWKLLLKKASYDSAFADWREQMYAVALYRQLAQQSTRPLTSVSVHTIYPNLISAAQTYEDFVEVQTLLNALRDTPVDAVSLDYVARLGRLWDEQEHRKNAEGRIARHGSTDRASPGANDSSFLLRALDSSLFDTLVEHFSITEVLNLRLTCKQLASLCHERALGPKFWWYQLVRDPIASIVLPEAAEIDISEETYKCKHLVQGAYLALRKREAWAVRRAILWYSLDVVLFNIKTQHVLSAQSPAGLDLELLDLSEEPEAGPSDATSPDHQSPKDPSHILRARSFSENCPELILTRESYFTGPESLPHSDTSVFGPGEICHAGMLLSWPPTDTALTIYVSMVNFGERGIICGLRVCRAGSSSILSEIGYYNPYSTLSADLPGSAALASIDIGQCTLGISSVRFNMRDGTSSAWLGSSCAKAWGTLPVHSGGEDSYLVIGLERCRVLNIGIGRPRSNPESRCWERPSLRETNDARIFLWQPFLEQAEHLSVIFSPFLLSGLDNSQEYLKVVPPFGSGSGGKDLVRIDCCTVLGHRWGFQFCYSDGSIVRYPDCDPSPKSVITSMFVSTSLGERVVRFMTAVGNGVVQVMITTNFGQEKIFRMALQVASDFFYVDMRPEGGHVVGVIVPELDQPQLCALGVLVAPLTDVTPDDIDLEAHAVSKDWTATRPYLQLDYSNDYHRMLNAAPEIVNYSVEFASFRGLRKLTPCVTRHGSAGVEEFICGLVLEYHDHPTPASLGFMAGNIGGGVELARGEHIRSIQFSGERSYSQALTDIARVRQGGDWNMGSRGGSQTTWPGGVLAANSRTFRIDELAGFALIIIYTTLSRTLTLRVAGMRSIVEPERVVTFEARQDETIAAMSWRIVGERALLDAQITGGTRPSEFLMPFDQVRADRDRVEKLYFEGPEGDSPENPVVYIDVFYQGSKLRGIRFIYLSGAGKLAGQQGDSQLRMLVPEGHRLVALTAEYGCSRYEIDIEIRVHKPGLDEAIDLRFEHPNRDNFCGYVERHVWTEPENYVEEVQSMFEVTLGDDYFREAGATWSYLESRGANWHNIAFLYPVRANGPHIKSNLVRFIVHVGRGFDTHMFVPETEREPEEELASARDETEAESRDSTTDAHSPGARSDYENAGVDAESGSGDSQSDYDEYYESSVSYAALKLRGPTATIAHHGPESSRLCGIYVPFGFVKNLGAIYQMY
ncbi:uncharacterized protein V1510DRAFT_103829 [Dipodascopsis tothii]|uniref:uncharacterized protein n=1 Tax=Dipodascopsis tothii TaxID=44089 RepID=UPI0034CEFE9C